MTKKIIAIIQESLPIIIMVGCIPLITNDSILTLVYVISIAGLLSVRRNKNDLLVLVVGFFAMTIFESIFIVTGVETFVRNSLFGIMPLWLPFLWAYGFVVIKRSISIIESK